jgi:cyclic 2,3-diphosphoglycerate synthetase
MMKGAEILLCEIKAAAIDVATRQALSSDLDVVYMDNVPVALEDDDVGGAVEHLAQLATDRFGSSRGT